MKAILPERQVKPHCAVPLRLKPRSDTDRLPRESGQPLEPDTRAHMESRFGHDFGRVRVHTSSEAAHSASDLHAAAYTYGHDIVFGRGRYAPGSPDGRQLIAHELAHVIQQEQGHAPLSIQRQPVEETPPKLSPYKSTDPVVDLKSMFKGTREAFELTLRGDFGTPESVERLIWPTRPRPPGVDIKLVMKVEVMPTEPSAKAPPAGTRRTRRPQATKPEPAGDVIAAVFELTGIEPFTLVRMDPLFAEMFTNLGVKKDSQAIVAARAAFRSRHEDLGTRVLDNIDAALKLATRNNPDLLEAFYSFYAHETLTSDIDRSSGNAGDTDRTIGRGLFTDINEGVLKLEKLEQLKTNDPLLLLGGTLIHEYAHTAHASDNLKGPGEGKAYGIENFLSERMGDKLRDEATLDVGKRMGDPKAFDVSYQVMKDLYAVMESRPGTSRHLKGVTPQRAREMSVEFISKNKKDFSAQLKTYILAEFGQEGFNSLPSQEER